MLISFRENYYCWKNNQKGKGYYMHWSTLSTIQQRRWYCCYWRAIYTTRTKQLLKRLPLSIGHAWCMALQLLFEQNLTLISTEIKITGVIRYNKSSCPWPGCLLQSKRGLPQSSHCVGLHKALRNISQALTCRKHFLRHWVWNYPPHVQLDCWSSANTDLLLSSYCCGCGWTGFTRCWRRYSIHWT